MYNPLGYKALRTFQQATEIYELTKKFCALYLNPVIDRRLIDHMESSGRSGKQNIAEGHGRNSTKANIEFLGFSIGSLNELLEDYFDLEKDYKEGQRKTKKNKEEALAAISQLIKLLMGELTMLKRQREGLEKRYVELGDERESLGNRRNQEKKKRLLTNYYGRW